MIQVIKYIPIYSQIQFWNIDHYLIYMLPLCSLQEIKQLFLFDSSTRNIPMLYHGFKSVQIDHADNLLAKWQKHWSAIEIKSGDFIQST